MTIIKRFFDIVCSLIGIIFFIPAYIVIYIILKITSRGPAIFKQERIGKGGKPFDIYKFRTMVPNTEEDGIPLLAEVNDERLTTFGKYLREHHLDELPQLWNVLRGDMSFVGYRPERKYLRDKTRTQRPDYAELYRMRPGITSMATLYNGYTNTMEKMIRRLDMDLDYLNNFSLLLDMKIVANTFLSVIVGKKF